MSYRVLKKIHGHYYWYEQQTQRHGRTVKTIYSKCLGRAGVFAPYAKPDKVRHDLDIRIDTARLYLSVKSLEKDWFKVNSILRNKGCRSPLPRIILRYGFQVGAFRSGLGYEVTATKDKGNRERVRFAYRKALAFAVLEVVAAERPALYETLERAFDPSYRATQDALYRYYANTESKFAFARALALKWFGQANKPHPSMKPSTLGVSEWGQRQTWQAELTGLMAEVIGGGAEKLYDEANKGYFNAGKEEQEAVKMPFFWLRAKKRKLARATARKALYAERMRKLEMVQRFLTLQ